MALQSPVHQPQNNDRCTSFRHCYRTKWRRMPRRLAHARRFARWSSKQRCIHRTTTLRELDELLQAYDMKRNLVELNYEAAQWKHKAVWNRRYMEAKRGQGLIQMWNEHEIDITKKTSNSLRSRQTTSSGQQVLRPSTHQPTY